MAKASRGGAVKQFQGITNPRQTRVLKALIQRRKLWREEIDRIAGASNGPHVIKEMRDHLNLDLPCTRVLRIDSDGRKCRPGVYALSDRDRIKVAAWIGSGKP